MEEEAQAKQELVKWEARFSLMLIMRSAIELGIPDIVENHPDGILLADLASKIGCLPEPLFRVMRLLTHHKVFESVTKLDGLGSPAIAYVQTARSHLLKKDKMATYILNITSPESLACKTSLGKYLLSKSNDVSAFAMGNGMSLWEYMEVNVTRHELFNNALAGSVTTIMTAVIKNHLAAFEGIGCLVDVGGGNGTAVRVLAKSCPWINRAINFDLPPVVAPFVNEGRVEYVGGDMFDTIPTADTALLVRVLHNWDDASCVKILKNCMKAIREDTGKVIIVDAAVDEKDGISSTHMVDNLFMDIDMMTFTRQGRERTPEEWDRLLKAAGFANYTIKHFPSIPQSVIEAYP